MKKGPDRVFTDNFVVSSLHNYNSSIASSGSITTKYTPSLMNRDEFVLIRVDGDKPISSFELYRSGHGDHVGMNFEIRRMSTPNEFPEFFEALGNLNSFTGFADKFPSYTNSNTGRNASDILNMFDVEVGRVYNLTQAGFKFTVDTENISMINSW